jgi:hypothetical protein
VGALVIVVWSTMLSALENMGSTRVASSVSSFTVEVFSVVLVSSFGSYTVTITKIFTDNSGTVVVIPEVVRSQWSPLSISSFSVDPTFRCDFEF